MRDAVFTQPWAEAWRRELETSSTYREAAASWEGSILLVARAEGDEAERSVFLDLEHGRCHAARVATAADAEAADYRISAAVAAWDRVLAGELDPIWALMSGRLRLEHGSLARLTPHARAAKELLAAARRVEEASAGAAPSSAPARSPEAVQPEEPAARTSFQSTSARGLDRDLPPMRLWRKAKRMGIWNPDDIDLGQDRADWLRLSELERDVLLRLAALFQGGEEAVTLDLLPLIRVVAREGRLEEEMYLTSFLWEEAKHVDAFRRFLDEVAEDRSDLSRFHTTSYRRIFLTELPEALGRLETDASPAAQARASVTYNMIVEGVLAETGYHAFYATLERNGILPGMLEIVGHLKADESRHLAYGVYLLSRLVAEHGEPIWREIESHMARLLEPALAVVSEIFDAYETMPFGLELEEFTDFARDQFQRRVERVEKARRQTLEDVLAG